MKRVVGTVVMVVALVLAAVPAGAAVSPTERRLLRDVATLKRQVRTLQTQTREANQGLNVLLALTMCDAALTADALQGTWTVIDQQAQAAGRPPVFGAQTPLNDSGACNAFRISRSQAVPPSIAGFSAFLGLVRASARVVNAVKLPS
jgi:hypothetical protein